MTLGALLRGILDRIFALFSGGSSPIAGVLGLAAAVYSLYYLRGQPAPPKPEEAGPAQIDQPSTSKAAQASSSGQGPAPATAAPSSAAALVARRLRSVNRVTVCAPGVLLQESTADELSESATPIPAAVAALLEAARYAEVFLLAHVADDIGDALVRGALEYAGVVGQEPGQVPPQRLLFCETVQGKVSIVRQLEPGLHIDSDARTVSELQRFVAQLVHVQGGVGGAPPVAGNVQTATSMQQALGIEKS